MAILTDQAVEALQLAVSQIALRANRLNDLMRFGEIYRNVDNSYRAFFQTVRSGEEKGINWAQVEEMWSPFKNFDLPTLSTFVRKSQYISKRISNELEEDMGAMIDDWISQLNKQCDTVQTVIDNQAKTLRTPAMQIQTTLMTQTAEYKSLLNREVEQLCKLTDSLRDRLK